MSAGRICTRSVVTAAPGENVRAAAQRMAERDVGALMVVEPDGSPEAIGMLTDRDIAVRCVAEGNPRRLVSIGTRDQLRC